MFNTKPELFLAVPLICFALQCHIQCPAVFYDLKGGSVAKMDKIARLSTGLCLALYVPAGVFGYFFVALPPCHGSNDLAGCMPADILDAVLFNAKDAPTDVARFCIAVSSTGCFALNHFPARMTLWSVWCKLARRYPCLRRAFPCCPTGGKGSGGRKKRKTNDSSLDEPLLSETTAILGGGGGGVNSDGSPEIQTRIPNHRKAMTPDGLTSKHRSRLDNLVAEADGVGNASYAAQSTPGDGGRYYGSTADQNTSSGSAEARQAVIEEGVLDASATSMASIPGVMSPREHPINVKRRESRRRGESGNSAGGGAGFGRIPSKFFYLETTVFFVLAFALAVGYPDINAVFGLLGSTCAVCVIFVLPTMFWVKFSPLPYDPMMSPRSSPWKALRAAREHDARARAREPLHVVTTSDDGVANAAGELAAYDALPSGNGSGGGGRPRAETARELRLRRTLGGHGFGWSKAYRRYRWRFWAGVAFMSIGVATGFVGTLMEIFKIANCKFLYA